MTPEINLPADTRGNTMNIRDALTWDPEFRFWFGKIGQPARLVSIRKLPTGLYEGSTADAVPSWARRSVRGVSAQAVFERLHKLMTNQIN